MNKSISSKVLRYIPYLICILVTCLIVTGCDSADKHPGEARTPSGSSIQEGRDYQKVVQDFSDHGFTNIKTVAIEDLIVGWLTKEGEVEDVSVGGDVNYYPDKWVPADTEVIIRYHAYPSKKDGAGNSSSIHSSASTTESSKAASESTKNEVSQTSEESSEVEQKEYVNYHSSHDKETAILGNSGIFAYDNNGSSYETYYIIDFDQGLVYSFNVGNGDTSGDVGSIVSGDLNSHIEVSYSTDDGSYIMGISFAYKNRPDHAIVEDSYHNTYDFYTTDLNSALALKNKYSFPEQ